MNTETKISEFYLKFPSVLRDFLSSSGITFPAETLFTYESFSAYRGVIRNAGESNSINKDDFLSYAELKKRPRGADINDIAYYSCSLFLYKESLVEALKLPKPNKKIIMGIVNCDDGPQNTNIETGHVNWWLYDNNISYQSFHFLGDECNE